MTFRRTASWRAAVWQPAASTANARVNAAPVRDLNRLVFRLMRRGYRFSPRLPTLNRRNSMPGSNRVRSAGVPPGVPAALVRAWRKGDYGLQATPMECLGRKVQNHETAGSP